MIPDRARRVFHLLDLRCEEVAAFLSASLDRRLPRGERVAVALHLVICPGCRRYRRQLALIREALTRLAPDAEPPARDEPPRLPAEARARIREALRSDPSGRD